MEPIVHDFYGEKIQSVRDTRTNTIYVGLKAIVDHLGIDPKTQSKRIKDNPHWGCIKMPVDTNGGRQNMIVIPLKTLNLWLCSINPTKVKETIKEKLIRYQTECAEVLHNYWTKGSAHNPRFGSDIDFSDPMALQNPQAVGILAQALLAGQKAMTDLAAANEKLERIIKNDMELLEDVWAKLGMTRNGQPVHVQEGIDKLRKAGILLKNKDRNIPFANKCRIRYFDKFEGTLVGTKGVLEFIALMEEEGVYTNDVSLQNLARMRHVNPNSVQRDEDGTIRIGDEIIVPAVTDQKLLD